MMMAYVGSFSYKDGGGIHICDYNKDTGKFTYKKSVFPHINAGFVCVRGDKLYATDERPGNPEQNPRTGGGSAYTFKIDTQTGDLSQIGCVRTLGVNPSHITFDEQGKFAVITHFSIGPEITQVIRQNGTFTSVPVGNDCVTCLFSITEDGAIGSLDDVYWHKEGGSPVSMIHKSYQRPGENIFVENDLGADLLYFFSINHQQKTLEYLNVHQVEPLGAGPRHGVFHPRLPIIYTNYERKCAVSWHSVSDPLNPFLLGELHFLPPREKTDARSDNQSELLFHPNGKFIYTFLRGKGYAIAFSVSEKTGNLRLLQLLKLRGSDPRGAAIDPGGKFLIVAGHKSGYIETLSICDDGTLKDTGSNCAMNNPACIAFFNTTNDEGEPQ